MQLFFNWHMLDRKHLTHMRLRMLAGITLICSLLMLFIYLLGLPTIALTALVIALLLIGLGALISSLALAKAVLLASIGIIEAVGVATTGSLPLIPIFLVLDAVLAWLLLKDGE